MNIIALLVCLLSSVHIRRNIRAEHIYSYVTICKSSAAPTLTASSLSPRVALYVCVNLLVSKDQVNEMIIINDNIIETNNKITT